MLDKSTQTLSETKANNSFSGPVSPNKPISIPKYQHKSVIAVACYLQGLGAFFNSQY